MAGDVVRWALVGVGRAGLARGRAIAADRRSALVTTWRGRYADRFPTARAAGSLDDALAGVDAVAIASPDDAHPEQVQLALRAGLHVVCEYPLAGDPRTALRLLDEARARGRVLHVGHIELLHAPQVALRARLAQDPARAVHQVFTRRGDAEAPPDVVAARNLARVHRLIDLAGPVVRVVAVDGRPGEVSARLEHATGATSRLSWSQSPYLRRTTTMDVHTRDGERWRLANDALFRGRIPQTLVEADPLFVQDHRAAVARILGVGRGYVEERVLVHALQVTRRIADGRVGAVGRA